MKINQLTNWFYTMNQIISKDSDIKPTHLLLDGGRVKIEDNLIDKFYKLYAECLINKTPIHIVEHKTKIFKFFIDLDFINDVEMTTGELTNIINIIQEAVFYMYEQNNHVIVCTTDLKNIMKDSIKYFKQGIHLYWPTIFVNTENAILIRKLIIHKLKSILGERNTINTWDDVVDLSVYKNNGIRMVGSSKCSYDRSNGKTVFIDDKRIYMPTLILDSYKNILDNKLKELLEDKYKMVVETSIRLVDKEITTIQKYPESLKEEECEECDDSEQIPTISKRVSSTTLLYQEIVRFFRIHVANYSADDIKKILNFDDKVYIILTKSKYCQNIGRAHNSCQIYFKLSKDGLCQKCHCICNTMVGRKYGYCKDYSSEYIKCSDHLLKFLKLASKHKNKDLEKIDLPTINQFSPSNIIDYRDKLYNQFTNKTPPKQRKKIK